jgi:hypothetical protein
MHVDEFNELSEAEKKRFLQMQAMRGNGQHASTG